MATFLVGQRYLKNVADACLFLRSHLARFQILFCFISTPPRNTAAGWCKTMPHTIPVIEKPAFEKIKMQTRNAFLHSWHALKGLLAIPRVIAFLTAFAFLSSLSGVALPTLTQAQTVSTAPYLDASGWTVFTPSASTRIIYVSSSQGNDFNDGLTTATPVKTIAKGLSLLRAGYPDWLLLKKGDVWTDEQFGQISVYGASSTEPMVFSSYDPAYPRVADPATGEARPLIRTPASPSKSALGMTGGTLTGGGNNLAIVGLEFYAYTRDPSYAGYNSAGATGIRNNNPLTWFMIEDCKISFFTTNITIGGGTTNVTIRRNVIADAYDPVSHSQGMFIARSTSGLLIEENLFDNNGWNADVSGAGQGNVFNHNIYLAGYDSWGNPSAPAIVRGNIFSNDSSGGQIRWGGTITNNLWVHNPYPFVIGMPDTFASMVSNNVFLEGIDPYAFGPDTMAPTYNGHDYNIGTVTISNNIIANTVTRPTISHAIKIHTGYSGNTIANNIIYNWGDPGKPLIIDDGTGDTVTGNVLDRYGNNNVQVPPEPFPDPTRSVGSYFATLGLGGSGQLTDFLSAARQQSKANWNPALSAAVVNDYIRAGFGVTSSTTSGSSDTGSSDTGSSVDTTPPSAPTDLTATVISDTQANLSWAASSDNVGVMGYEVFRDGKQVATTADASYQDTGLAGGASYTYSVAAYDAAGNVSSQSSSVPITTPSQLNVIIDPPKNGSVLKGNGMINITAAMSDSTTVQSITIVADSTVLATCSNVSSCSAQWHGRSISKGTHTINANAVGQAGQTANASATITSLK